MNRILQFHCTEEEFDELIFGLQTVITDRVFDETDRRSLENLIAKLEAQRNAYKEDAPTIGTPEEARRVALSLSDAEVERLEEEEENEAKKRAFYADERNHLYVDPDGVGPIIELP